MEKKCHKIKKQKQLVYAKRQQLNIAHHHNRQLF